MRVSHECPKCLLNESRQFNDYDYALVHLFEEDEEYFNFFKESISQGREVILDNSVFELGKAFDSERFLYWINKLNPTYYIIPDVLDNKEGTVQNIVNWCKIYQPRITGQSKAIGVVQGSTFEEAVECYKTISPLVYKIALSFNSKFYSGNTLIDWMIGRIKFITYLDSESILNKYKPHHLLGCSLPQEFLAYKFLPCIDTVDTSNPIVHGLYKIKYESYGLYDKVDTKLYTLLNATVDPTELNIIRYNINKFKQFIR